MEARSLSLAQLLGQERHPTIMPTCIVLELCS